MHITKWGEYGILCALFIAKRIYMGSEVVGAADIAKANDIAIDYAQQILQRLRKGQIIKSMRGSRGGYLLARPAREISLLDIIKASEGDSFEIICENSSLSIEDRCRRPGCCAIRPVWREVKEQLDSVLGKYDLATLCEIECNAIFAELPSVSGA